MARVGRSKRNLLVAGVAVLALAAVGLVYAAWTTSGSGSAYVKAGSSQALSTVDASATTTASLYPGAAGDVVLKVSNPNPYPVRITAVSLNGTNADIAADGSHSACSPTGVSFTNATGLSLSVPAKSGGVNGSAEHTLSGAASMTSTSVDACQGATFTIPVTLTGVSNAS